MKRNGNNHLISPVYAFDTDNPRRYMYKFADHKVTRDETDYTC